MEEIQHILLKKLDEFIRKFYKNKLVKGMIYTFTIVFLFFISSTVLAYFGNFNSASRTVIFFSFLSVALATVVSYIVIPLFKLYKLGAFIDHETAAKIIGSHFDSVKDKLLNTLQLIEETKTNRQENDLISHSINQKIMELKPIPFTHAIDISKNKKYLKYAAVPLFLFLGIFFVNARIISDGANKIVHYNQEFIPEAPFEFVLENRSMEAIENEDFELVVHLKGKEIPNAVLLNVNGNKIKLRKKDSRNFSYTFKHIQHKKSFNLEAAGFQSKTYVITPIIKPVIMGYSVEVNYPSHTNLPSVNIENINALSVPQGTQLTWRFKTKNTSEISFHEHNNPVALIEESKTVFLAKKTIKSNSIFSLNVANKFMRNTDTLVFQVSTSKDQHPTIFVEEKQDSITNTVTYFSGNIADDYGFSRLVFKFRRSSSDESKKGRKFTTVPLDFNSSYNQSMFHHLWDKDAMKLQLGERIEYYFEVWDNDQLNGYKSARTQIKTLNVPTQEELDKRQESQSESIKESLEKNIKKSQEIQQEIQQMTESILNKKNLDWQDKKKMKDLLDQQKELTNQNKEVLKKSQDKNKEESRYNKEDEELKKKQEKLEKLMEELNSDEMEKLYEKLEKMMEKIDKSKLQKSLEELNQENLDLKKEMERTLELFKQMEMDENLEEFANKMEELAKKQEELANKEDANTLEEQEKLSQEFKKAEKKLDELKEKNKDLENKKDLNEVEQDKEEAKDDMQESKENLKKGNKGKAQKSQKKAAQNMKSAAQKAKEMMSSSASSAEENIEDLRDLLENLISLSFDQEDVLSNLKRTNPNDPNYVKLGQRQVKIKEDAKMIEDSLIALSKRVEQIQPVVHKEMNKINDGISNSLSYIGERMTPNATQQQQVTMTSLNNLALMLDESLKQMQNQMAAQKPGGGSCNNPGGSNPKPGILPSLKKAKGEAGKGLKQLQKKLGKTGGKGKGKDSKELARMAAEQAMLRKAINEMSQELNGDGSGLGNELKKIEKELEKVEEDIVNNKITQETVNRQKDVLTRLLESEKALREREFDNKRESNSVKIPKKSNPNEYLEYKRKKEQELELLKTIPPSLLPYYKNRVNDYFNQTN